MGGELIEWLNGLSVRGIRPGLDGISNLLNGLGNPQKGLRAIHVAGSDGKGSVCCMMESVLLASGMRVGMFTTPHILDIRECIRIDGKEISLDLMERLLSEVKAAAESSGEECSNFEALTACAFLAFRTEDVDMCIVEVGMGGRLDSTNVILPEVTVVNNISLEHSRYLGSTLAEIASEKAGIMKPGVPCVTINSGPALDVIREHAAKTGCPLVEVGTEELEVQESHPDGIRIRYHSREFFIGIPGRHQARNAALAIETLMLLKEWSRLTSFIAIGLESAHWPARMEKLDGCDVILDVTHTKCGAQCLRDDISELYGKVNLVTAMLDDKDLDGVAEILSPIARKVYVSSPDSPRAATAGSLASHYMKYHNSVTTYRTVGAAVEAAMNDCGMVLVTGSFRTAEDCLRWMRRTL